MRVLVLASLIAFLPMSAFGPVLAQSDILPPDQRKPGIVKIINGTTQCHEPSKDDAHCASEYWSMYVHDDGSRYMHVVSDNIRAGQARHAMLWVDPEGETREAYLNTWSQDGVLGSAYVVKREETVDVAASDLMFERADEGMITEEVEAFYQLDTLGVGPASADGMHFLHYDFDAPGEQDHGIYWMGGSRHDTMVGVISLTEHTYLGEEEITIADGKTFTADVFQMISGTKLWLTKEDRVMLKMDLVFGTVAGSIFETTKLDIIEIGS